MVDICCVGSGGSSVSTHEKAGHSDHNSLARVQLHLRTRNQEKFWNEVGRHNFLDSRMRFIFRVCVGEGPLSLHTKNQNIRIISLWPGSNFISVPAIKKKFERKLGVTTFSQSNMIDISCVRRGGSTVPTHQKAGHSDHNSLARVQLHLGTHNQEKVWNGVGRHNFLHSPIWLIFRVWVGYGPLSLHTKMQDIRIISLCPGSNYISVPAIKKKFEMKLGVTTFCTVEYGWYFVCG